MPKEPEGKRASSLPRLGSHCGSRCRELKSEAYFGDIPEAPPNGGQKSRSHAAQPEVIDSEEAESSCDRREWEHCTVTPGDTEAATGPPAGFLSRFCC